MGWHVAPGTGWLVTACPWAGQLGAWGCGAAPRLSAGKHLHMGVCTLLPVERSPARDRDQAPHESLSSKSSW